MDAKSIKDEVISRLVEAIDLEDHRGKIENGSRLEQDLGMDSMQSVDLVLELEDVFDIEIDDEEIGRLETVGDVISLVEAKKTAS